MRKPIMVLIMLPALLNLPAFAAGQSDQTLDWDQWRYLPVLDGGPTQNRGRYKPLDTLARETLRTLCNRGSFRDPQTDQKLNPTALYFAMLFDWQGWDQPPNPHAKAMMDSHSTYFSRHKADKWDRAPLLRVDFLELREALGMAKDQKYISPLQLGQAKIQEPDTDRTKSFIAWAKTLIRTRENGFSTFERKALELATKFWAYQEHRMGRRLKVVPLEDGKHQQWVSVAHLLQSNFNDDTDPTGAIRKAKRQFQEARAAYRADSPESFNRASAGFIAAVKELGPQLGTYPSQTTIDLEVAYNGWVPFRFAWVFTLIAFLCLLLSKGSRWKPFYLAGMTTFVAGLAAMLVGFALRFAISGRVPVANMYESVLYMGLGVAVLGLIFELVYRKQYVITAAAAVATVTLVLADCCPAVLDPSITPLNPVLRNNFWLATHVMSIVLSYAAFALALGIGNITLGHYLVGSRNREATKGLSRFTYQTLQIGVLLLAVGIVTGGIWADFAWGRFWGWDPKEVWALIALLGYVAVLHARFVGWAGNLGLAALSVTCFSLIVWAWYGVNFLMGSGLHSYGFGGGGQILVFSVLGVQLLYVLVAIVVSANREPVNNLDKLSLAEEATAKPTSNAAAHGRKVAS